MTTKTCGMCGGSGTSFCNACGGKGWVYRPPQPAPTKSRPRYVPSVETHLPCTYCLQSGKQRCWSCNGKGYVNV